MTPQKKLEIAYSFIDDADQNNLTDVDLSNFELEDYQLTHLIERIIIKLPNIESLNLCNNELTEIPPQIKDLKGLRFLHISNNKLQRIPAEISELKNLEELDCSVNKITEVPNEVRYLDKLAYLNLGNNMFYTFPREICNITHLEYLIINENEINDIPAEIIYLQNLCYLDLNRNYLSTGIPDNVCKLQKLEYLDVSENDLHEVNEQIVNLEQLIDLCLQENNIANLPDNIGDLKRLHTLDLHDNDLSEIPSSIDNSKNLRYLNLKNNPLSEDAIYFMINNLENTDIDFDMDGHKEASNYEEVLALIYPGETNKVINLINNLNPYWKIENGNGAVKMAKEDLRKIQSKEIDDPHGTKKLRAQRLLEYNTLDAKSVVIEFLKKIPIRDSKIEKDYLEGAKDLIDIVLDTSENENTRLYELHKIAESLGNCPTPIRGLLSISYVLKYANIEPKPEDYHSLLARVAIINEVTTQFKDKTINGKKILRGTEKIEQVEALINAILLEGAADYIENKCKIVFKNEERPRPLTSRTDNLHASFTYVSDNLAIEFAKLCCETQENGEPLLNKEGNYMYSTKKVQAIVDKYKSENLGHRNVKELIIKDFIRKVETFVKDHPDITSLHYANPEVIVFIAFNKLKDKMREMLFNVTDIEAPKVANDFFNTQKSKIERILNDNTTEEMQIEGNTTVTTTKLKGLGTPSNNSRKNPHYRNYQNQASKRPKLKR